MTFGDKFWSWYNRNFSKICEFNIGHWMRAAMTALQNLGFDEIHSPGGVAITQDAMDWIDSKIGDGSWGKFEIFWPSGWDFVLFTNVTYCDNVDGKYYFFRDLVGKDLLSLWIVKKLAKWGVNNPAQLSKIMGMMTGIVTGAVRFVTTKARRAKLNNTLEAIKDSEDIAAVKDTIQDTKLTRILRLIGFKLM